MTQRSKSGVGEDINVSLQTSTTALESYERYIYGLVAQWPQLRIVKDFMSVDLEHCLTPIKSKLYKTNVRAIDIVAGISPSAESVPTRVAEYRLANFEEFQRFINKPRLSNITARLFLVEDLSAGIIEILGDTFGLDPEFFAQHLNNWWRHYQGYWTPYSAKAGYIPHPLPSIISK